MANEKVPLTEYLKTDSVYSMMRLGFVWILRTAIIIGILMTASWIALPFLFKIAGITTSIDYTPIIALEGTLLGAGFVGKASQAFAEARINPTQANVQAVADQVTTAATMDTATASMTRDDPNLPR